MENQILKENTVRTSAKDLVVTGLLIAMVFIGTMFINIRLPISINGGLVHLGNVILFTVSFTFGKKKGAMAGAFGMGLFDILSGWTAWAPFTFIIRGIMGYLLGSISNYRGKNGESILINILAIIISGIWMIGGYYLTEVILYGNWITPVTSVPGNITQLVIGLFALLLTPAIKKIKNIL
ncbi:ECF transporter S component [Alkalibaculum sporogenes]|uniref:ECF transporter S component n=1 Tax=Alkalibaculum sporogenes TaxID=2655001 RepID=UPI0031B5D97E